MSISYTKIRKRPQLFLRIFGVTPTQLDEMVIRIKPLFEKRIKKKYKRPGRNFKLSLEDMVLMVLLYYRVYTSQLFVGFWFGIDQSRVCRIIQKMEPLLESVMALPQRKHLSEEEAETMLMDATEHSIERPQKDQKKYYSGKKKRHTIKNEIRTTKEGRILYISDSKPGSIHDFNLHKQQPPLPLDARVYVDSGYQGLNKVHSQTELPYKATQKRPFDEEEREYNSALSRVRVTVENKLANIKVFKIMSDRYRNKRKRHSIKIKIIAGIVNMKNGFAFC